VDFTNVAAAGEQLGWRTLTYGPQSVLEHISRRNVTMGDSFYSVPGYGVLTKSWASRHVQNWYGRETLASSAETSGWEQRWTSFKALLMEKPKKPSNPKPNSAGASTPLPCRWRIGSRSSPRRTRGRP